MLAQHALDFIPHASVANRIGRAAQYKVEMVQQPVRVSAPLLRLLEKMFFRAASLGSKGLTRGLRRA